MKKTFIYAGFCATLLMGAGYAVADEIKIPVNQVNPDGIGKEIGEIAFVDVPDGVEILVDLNSLPSGEHGMHIHQNPSCAPAEQDGKMVAALGAGGHWDPADSKHHLGPGKDGHKGDLPFITANAQGLAKQKLAVKGLTTKELRGHSVMIHAGGDTYTDTPPLGGGGARIACGVIK